MVIGRRESRRCVSGACCFAHLVPRFVAAYVPAAEATLLANSMCEFQPLTSSAKRRQTGLLTKVDSESVAEELT